MNDQVFGVSALFGAFTLGAIAKAEGLGSTHKMVSCLGSPD